MECDTPLPAVCIDWVWLSLIFRIQKSACCGETRGYLGRRRITSATVTSTMSFFPADIRWIPTATPLTSTMERLTVPSRWRAPACALYWIGLMPMEIRSREGDQGIDETVASPNGWLERYFGTVEVRSSSLLVPTIVFWQFRRCRCPLIPICVVICVVTPSLRSDLGLQPA